MNSRTSLPSIFILFFCALSLYGQRPEAVKFEGAVSKTSGFRAVCPGSFAGTVKVTKGATNKSNNIQYLCFNDVLNITHDKNATFKDPDNLTQHGIGYVYFDCKPTINGPDLASIVTDPCVNKKSPIIINGKSTNLKDGMWISKGDFEGNHKFDNDGFLQNTYNNGKPVQFWFAPITLDFFTSDTSRPTFEKGANGKPGECINVNVDAAFSVVYLNEVKIANVTGNNGGMNNYTGTFTVTGGLPEFDPLANYTKVTIVNIGDPNKIGVLTNGPATNGKPMTFSVPTPGKYRITIEDVNGCSVTTNVPLTIEENPGLIKVICADGKIGDEICYTVNLGQIPDLTSAQFTISFNTQALQFTGGKNISPELNTPIDQAVITNDIDKGFIKFFWFDFNLVAHDFTKEVPLVQLCFKIKGPPGITPFRIVPNPGGNLPNLELSNLDGNSIPLTAATGSILECNSTILPNSNLDAFYNQCGPTLFGQMFGGKEGYKLKYRLLPNAAFKDSLYINQVSKLTSIFANQTSGKYELVVTDTLNAQIIDSFDYDANLSPLSIDLSSRDNPSCKGNDGRITAMVSASVKSPKYLWSNGNISPTISQLIPGTYTVTVTDIQGCTATESVTLNSTNVKSAIIVQNKASCTGINDGNTIPDFANIVGLAPFTTQWIGPGVVIGNRFSSLGKGPVGLIVTDKRGCADTAFVDVSSTRDIVADVTIDNLQCFGANDGRITLLNRRFNNGDPLINDSVLITNPTGAVSYFPLKDVRYNPLGIGRYPIRIKDQSGCLFDTIVNITQPAILDTAKVTVKLESCSPGNDGSILITMTGGTAPYKYNWGPSFPIDTNQRVSLTQGNYSVSITDKNGCKTSFPNLPPFVFARPVIKVTIDTTAILCFGTGAKLTAKPDSNYTIKSYKWSNGDTLKTATNVLANIKTNVEVTDVNGCKGSDTVTLSQPGRLRLIDSTIIPPPCPDLATPQGTIRLQASGGTGPYLYTLTGGPAQNFGQFSRLKSAKYTITITDANQCPAYIVNTEVIEPPRIVGVFDPAGFKSVKCAGTGDCSGQARLLLSGGTDPNNRFTVRWESTEVTQNTIISTADSLCAGNQTVRITDGMGCSTTLSFSIVSPEFISRDAARTTVKDIVCAGNANGTVNYVAFGGTSPYKYRWGDNDTNSIRSGLIAGKYGLQITDLNNCTFSDSISITEPPALKALLDSLKTRTITCNGQSDGQIGIKVSGGNTGKLVYSWSPNFPDTSFIRNVKPGAYTVFVMDVKGCKDSVKYTMDQPTMILPVLSLVFNPKCANDTAGVFVTSVSGGNGASFTYSINNGTTIPIAKSVPLKAGNYQLTVFDRKGCSVDTAIKVIDPAAFNIDLGPDKKIRLGDSIRITTIGNNPLAKVNWQNIGEVTCLTADCSVASLHPVRSTIFTTTALDQSGCKATDQISITVDERRAVYIPNAFRPDQLSANQDFRFFSGSGIVAIHYGRIFNRWGDVISEVQNLPPDAGGVVIWDGRYRGGSADPGVYVYVIDVEFSDGVRLVYKGDVTLIR